MAHAKRAGVDSRQPPEKVVPTAAIVGEPTELTRQPGKPAPKSVRIALSNKMEKKRTYIPRSTVSDVHFRADLRCCVCEGDRPGYHFHHLDGNPANNVEDNLVLLCFKHHNKASKTGGLSRKLDAGTIRRYRDLWFGLVSRRRASAVRRVSGRTRATGQFEVAPEAVQIAAVRVRWRAADHLDWASFRDALICAHAHSTERGQHVREEVLEVACQAAGYIRRKMPIDTIRIISSLTSNAAVQVSITHRGGPRVDRGEQKYLALGGEIGFSIVHDGATYLQDLSVVDSGADVLWLTLRCAQANRLTGAKQRILESFDSAIGSCKSAGSKDALDWLEFQQADALALGDAEKPAFPQALAGRVHR